MIDIFKWNDYNVIKIKWYYKSQYLFIFLKQF